jgi:hypothetical protein
MKAATAIRLSREQGRMFLGNAPKKQGRYRVAPREQRTIDGIVFDSKAEAGYYAELKLRERIGEISSLVCQFPLEIEINGKHFATFTVDFAFTLTGMIPQYHEVKSLGTKREKDYRLRRKAAELYHNIKIVEVIR